MNSGRVAAVAPFAGTWALFGLGLAVVYSPAEWQATVGVLMISQAFSGALAWHRFGKTAAAVLPDFLTMLLFMKFVTKVLTAAGVVVDANPDLFGEVGERLEWRESVPMEYQFQAELVFVCATVVFTLVWRVLEGRTPLAVWREPHPRAMWWTYALALAAYVLLSAGPLGRSFGASLELMKMFSIGALAVLLGGRTHYALGRSKAWLPIVALAPLYLLALRTGMKGEVAMVSLPFLLPIFRRLNLNRAMLLASFVVVVVLFVFPFSQAWREANWSARGETADVPEVASHVYSRWQQEGLLETAAASTARWLARGSSAEQGGLVMMLAEQDGLLGPVLLEGLATIFVPRFVWPDKPLYQPGAWFTWYLGHADSPETATTATAMMLPTELYWMFGIGGVILGMAMIAVLYFFTWKFLLRRSARGLLPLVALFALLARSGGGLEEIHTIYAISSPIILTVYVVLFDYAQRILTPVLAGRALRRRVGSP
jgi:hypothetical protein